jgi:formate hydrogenlyase subunit 3/multisubunit Na+/H+ antiporter MnhD subunit
VVVLSGGLLAAMYLFKILSLAFDNTLDVGTVQRRPKALSSKVLTVSALVLALITLALGFNAEFILNISNPLVEVNGL